MGQFVARQAVVYICSCIVITIVFEMTIKELIQKKIQYMSCLRIRTCSFTPNHFKRMSHKPMKPIVCSKKRALPIRATFLSDVQLYDMSGMDIFLSSAMRNMITLHIPSMVIYRSLYFSWGQTAVLTLFVSILKTILQLILLGY